MSISFSEIPADNLVPMFMTEFDNSNAAKGGAMPWKNLLIGQALSANSANAGTLKLITSDEQADALYGAGSQIARMIRAFRKNTRNSELWALAVADGTTAAEGEIEVSFANSATAAPKSGAIRLIDRWPERERRRGCRQVCRPGGKRYRRRHQRERAAPGDCRCF